jgi:hypothetical protein
VRPAHRLGRAFEGWWERDSRVAEAVHALYFGTPSPERAARAARRTAGSAWQDRLMAHRWPGAPIALASAVLFGASTPFAKLLLPLGRPAAGTASGI